MEQEPRSVSFSMPLGERARQIGMLMASGMTMAEIQRVFMLRDKHQRGRGGTVVEINGVRVIAKDVKIDLADNPL